MSSRQFKLRAFAAHFAPFIGLALILVLIALYGQFFKPDVEFFQQALGFRVGNYGMTKWSDLFTPRQLVALTTFCDLVQEAGERAQRAAEPPNHSRVRASASDDTRRTSKPASIKRQPSGL